MGGHSLYSANHIRRASRGPAECQSSGNQHHYLAAAAAAAPDDETSGRMALKAQVMPPQWPYISSLESSQLATGQSLSLLDSNKWPGGQQQRQHYLATPNAWHRPLAGAGQCSTFAAADVRRAIRLVTSNSSLSSASTSGKPSLSTSPATYLQLACDRRRSRKLALVEGRLKGCMDERKPKLAGKLEWHLPQAQRPPALSIGQPPSEPAKFKWAAKQTNGCKIVEQRERLAADSLYSSVDVVEGPRSELIINDNLSASKSLDNIPSSSHQVQSQPQQQPQQQQQQINTQDEPIDSMQSIHSLSMQFDRQTTSIIQHQQQQQQRHLLGQSSAASMGPTTGGQLADTGPAPIELQQPQQQNRQLSASMSTNSLMASNKLGRLVGKKASRVKELLLQNLLGRADRTHDELFELYEENFFKQQHQANKIAKEFKSYLAALRAFHEAGKSLNHCIQQATGDYQSARHDLVCENLAQMEQLNDDLLEKLREQVMVNIGQYLTQFAELKDKISKRHRKLIDFDSSRRAFELTLNQIQKKRQQRVVLMNGQQQQHQQQQQQVSGAGFSQLSRGLKFLAHPDGHAPVSAPQAPPPPPPPPPMTGNNQQQVEELSDAGQLVDEARLLKLREQFNYCKIMYETINGELHDELPNVYEKKMKSLLRTLQNYFALEAHYHSNAGKLMATASDVIDELPELTAGAASLIRRRQAAAARKDGHFSAHEDDDDDDDDDHEDVDDDDDDDDEDDEDHDDDDGDGHSNHHVGQQVLKQVVGVNASPSSSDQLYEDAGDAGDAAVVCAKIGGGAGSSGVGSSRADSSSSAASSPDLTGSKEAGESGKAEGPAEPADDHLLRPGSASSSPDAGSRATDTPAAAVDKEDERHNQQAAQDRPAMTTSGKDCSEELAGEAEAEAEVEAEADKKVSIVEGSESSGQEKREGEQVVVVVVPAPEPKDDATISTKGAIQAPTNHSLQLEEPSGGPSQSGYLYKVKTNYKYLAEDVDELCFEADEVLQVVEFGEAQEPEEGWLMGVRELNGQRGLFPANFTRPI